MLDTSKIFAIGVKKGVSSASEESSRFVSLSLHVSLSGLNSFVCMITFGLLELFQVISHEARMHLKQYKMIIHILFKFEIWQVDDVS